jgi:hypothetical protein
MYTRIYIDSKAWTRTELSRKNQKDITHHQYKEQSERKKWHHSNILEGENDLCNIMRINRTKENVNRIRVWACYTMVLLNGRTRDKTHKCKSYRFNKLLFSIFQTDETKRSKALHLRMYMYCKAIIIIGSSILMIDRAPQILVSNCIWSHINTGIYNEKPHRPIYGTPAANGLNSIFLRTIQLIK